MTTQELMHKIDVAWGRPVSRKFIEEFREYASGTFDVEVKNVYGELIDAEYERHNVVTNQGLEYLLGVGLNSTTDITTWYLSMYASTHTPGNGDVAADVGTTPINEIDTADVTQGGRITWQDKLGAITGTTIKSLANSTAVTYTCDTAGFTAYGAFLLGYITPTATFQNSAGNCLYAISNFGTSKTLTSTDTIDVTYTVTLQDTAT